MRVIAYLFVIFSLSNSAAFSQIEDFANIDFRKADSIANLYPNHSISNLNGLADKLTLSLTTDVEKFRAIYVWTSKNIENDFELYAKNKEKREKIKDPKALQEWNEKFARSVFQTLLTKHRTVCTGYAYLIQEMSKHAGLSCELINGYGRTADANIGGPGFVNHSWNAVQLNSKWYLCDATWSSGSVNTQERSFIKKFDDCYFLLAPTLFVRNHYPSDFKWTLLEQNPTLQEFLNRPLVYKDIFKYNVTQLYPETFEITVTKGKPISFQFNKNDIAIDKVELQIERHSGTTSIFPSVEQNSNGLSSINYTFTTKGTYVVHARLNDGFVFTYSVNVK